MRSRAKNANERVTQTQVYQYCTDKLCLFTVSHSQSKVSFASDELCDADVMEVVILITFK